MVTEGTKSGAAESFKILLHGVIVEYALGLERESWKGCRWWAYGLDRHETSDPAAFQALEGQGLAFFV